MNLREYAEHDNPEQDFAERPDGRSDRSVEAANVSVQGSASEALFAPRGLYRSADRGARPELPGAACTVVIGGERRRDAGADAGTNHLVGSSGECVCAAASDDPDVRDR